MIIQNTTSTSSASRQYRSCTTQQTRCTIWNNATNSRSTMVSSTSDHVMQTSVSENGASVKEEELTEQSIMTSENGTLTPIEDTPEEETDVIKKEINAFLEQFEAKRSFKIRSLEERAKEIQKIQRESIHYLLQSLFGKKTSSPKDLSSFVDETMTNTSIPESDISNVTSSKASLGGTYETFYYYEEHETTCFDTKGTVKTADGREISFQINLEMSRSFTEKASTLIDFGEPRLFDPLVINLNTNVASVSDQKFFFDLDSDGTAEEISKLHSDSGYLALDKNNDGTINNGNELFGTNSGNGFADLQQYDFDKNGWIDEADAIFKQLKIWIIDENNNSHLISLKEAGVGAICLNSENTNFSLTDTKNNVNAVIRKTGLFLYENGYTGTVQQLDLAT